MWDIEADVAAELVGLLRGQRHDFLNHLQVVLGYLQMNKKEQALEYARQAIEESGKRGNVLALAYPQLSLWLYLQAIKAYRKGLKVEFLLADNLARVSMGGQELLELVALAWTLAMARAAKGFTIEVRKAGDNNLLAFHGDGLEGADEELKSAARAVGAELVAEKNGFAFLLPCTEAPA